ncbi:hypothetical protein [Streptomyces sp. NPDC054838]
MDDYYLGLDDEFDQPVLMRRSLANRIAFWATQVRALNPQDAHIIVLADGLDAAAKDAEADTDPFEDLPAIVSARQALTDLRNALRRVGGDVSEALVQTNKPRRQKHELDKLTRRLKHTTSAHQSTIKEAQRQAKRASRAEAELARLQGGTQ